jgi:hypothetical protein
VRSFIGVFFAGHITRPKVGGAIVVRDVKSLKQPYNAPSFAVIDINAAKTELETNAMPENVNVRRMLALIDKRIKDKRIKDKWIEHKRIEEKKSASNLLSLNLVP